MMNKTSFMFFCCRVKDDGPDCSNLSMGACLDLLPVLRRLLESKFEEYENFMILSNFLIKSLSHQLQINFRLSCRIISMFSKIFKLL